MAEILLKVGPGAGYEDGDVLCAFNNRRIRCVHAEKLCALDGFNSDGLRTPGALSQYLREYTHQYKFVRATKTTVERINLIDGTVDVFGPEAIDVELFIKRRQASPAHAIFGIAGSEYWYGGSKRFTDLELDKVWNKIASDLNRLDTEEEFQLWPMGRLDIRHHLAVRVDNFSDEESAGLESPRVEQSDNSEIVIAKRNIKCDWRNMILGDVKATAKQVLDPNFAVGVDIRVDRSEMRHISKDQPIQINRSKLWNKTTNTAVPEI